MGNSCKSFISALHVCWIDETGTTNNKNTFFHQLFLEYLYDSNEDKQCWLCIVSMYLMENPEPKYHPAHGLYLCHHVTPDYLPRHSENTQPVFEALFG